MARPLKNSLDYFSFDVYFFSDKKINRLKATYGGDGILIYQYVLCQIYQNGYYTEYDEDFIAEISDYFHISQDRTMQILTYLFSRSLLVCIPADDGGHIVTAASVQRRYQEAKKYAKREIPVQAAFWLLTEEETEACIRLRPQKGHSEHHTDDSEKNVRDAEKHESFSENHEGFSEKNTTKQSKEKKSKEKQSKAEQSKARRQTAPPGMRMLPAATKQKRFIMPSRDDTSPHRTAPYWQSSLPKG